MVPLILTSHPIKCQHQCEARTSDDVCDPDLGINPQSDLSMKAARRFVINYLARMGKLYAVLLLDGLVCSIIARAIMNVQSH